MSIDEEAEEIILDLSNQLLQHDDDILLAVREENLAKLELWHYEQLERDIENNLISIARGNKYIMVKLPIKEIPDSIFTVFYEMQLRGYVPIIAQAERNILFRNNPTILYSIVRRGVLAQISASSLTGQNGRKLRSFSLKLCKHNLVHLISSDLLKSEKGTMPLRGAYGYLQKKLSVERTKNFQENAKHIMEGTDFHTLTPKKF